MYMLRAGAHYPQTPEAIHIRKQKKMSQEQLAGLLHVTRHEIQSLEELDSERLSANWHNSSS